MQINDLPSFRFSITSVGNGGTYALNFGLSRAAPQMTTYSKLDEKHIAELRLHTRAKSQQQVIRNHRTALRGFMASVHKTENSIVGPEMGAEFENCLKRHLSDAELSPRSKADRKSLLRAWKATHDSLVEHAALPKPRSRRERHSAEDCGHETNAFEAEVKRALKAAGICAKSAARLAGVSPSAVGRWCRGALPNRRSEPTLSKLETVLNLPAGQLSEVLASCLHASQSRPNSYRERLKAASAQAYRLQAREVNPGLQHEWSELLRYKTSTRPPTGLKRSSSGEWTLSQRRHSVMTPSWFNSVGEAICHTANKSWSMVSGFLGFVGLPEEEGGYGRSPDEAQTLAWLCVPNAVDAYLHFMEARSGGLRHEGHKTFCTMLTSLVRPTFGYMRQKPDLRERLPQGVASECSWDSMCDEVQETAATWTKRSTDISRDPDETIAYFLERDQPLRPIFEAMQSLRRLADGCTAGTHSHALMKRDELLLGFLVANPLRAKNISTLTWNPNNTGHIYKTASGQWRLKIEPREFKNRRKSGKKKVKTYDVAIASWLAPLLEDYITNHLPVLTGSVNSSSFLFTSRSGAKMESLNKKVLQLTKRFIPGCGGIGPQSFRHLVATVWLRQHPNDFLVVSELLNDTLQVVLDNYAHLKKDVSFSKYEAYVATSY